MWHKLNFKAIIQYRKKIGIKKGIRIEGNEGVNKSTKQGNNKEKKKRIIFK